LFTKSFWIAGFQCSTHRRRNGRRLDLIASTGHEVRAAIRLEIPVHGICLYLSLDYQQDLFRRELEEEETEQHAVCG
jgi:hypothetical protein